MSPRISNWTRLMLSKDTVNVRRVNKEKRRHDLACATFVNLPRLITSKGPKLPK